MQINVDKDMVAKAIFDSMTDENRNALVQGAIKSLIEDKRVAVYGKPAKTKLQEIFEECTYIVAREVVNEEMRKPETKALLSNAVHDAMLKALDPDSQGYDDMVMKLASAIHNGWTSND